MGNKMSLNGTVRKKNGKERENNGKKMRTKRGRTKLASIHIVYAFPLPRK
jgi:hypothetical protein